MSLVRPPPLGKQLPALSRDLTWRGGGGASIFLLIGTTETTQSSGPWDAKMQGDKSYWTRNHGNWRFKIFWSKICPHLSWGTTVSLEPLQLWGATTLYSWVNRVETPLCYFFCGRFNGLHLLVMQSPFLDSRCCKGIDFYVLMQVRLFTLSWKRRISLLEWGAC